MSLLSAIWIIAGILFGVFICTILLAVIIIMSITIWEEFNKGARNNKL